MSLRSNSVPEWTLHDGIDEHEDCVESPCEECLTLAAATPDPERE